MKTAIIIGVAILIVVGISVIICCLLPVTKMPEGFTNESPEDKN